MIAKLTFKMFAWLIDTNFDDFSVETNKGYSNVNRKLTTIVTLLNFNKLSMQLKSHICMLLATLAAANKRQTPPIIRQ